MRRRRRPRRSSGTNWILTDSPSLGAGLTVNDVSANFSAKRVNGSSGCNSYNAGIHRRRFRDDDRSGDRFHPAGMRVRSDCGRARVPGPAGEGALVRDRGQHAVALRHGTLAAARVHLRRRGRAIEGQWSVTSYYTGSAIQSVINGTEITADFDATSVSGTTGCSTYQADYTVQRFDDFFGTSPTATGPALTPTNSGKPTSTWLRWRSCAAIVPPASASICCGAAARSPLPSSARGVEVTTTKEDRVDEFEDKVAVVTGAASGIGPPLAEALLAAGCRVVIADIESQALDTRARAAGRRRCASGDHRSVTDVADLGVGRSARGVPPRPFGQVDIVCNNAGVSTFNTFERPDARRLAVGPRREPLGRDPRRAHVRADHAASRERRRTS